MSYPVFYNTERVGRLYKPDMAQVIDAGNQANVPVADDDSERIALLLVDPQVDFIHEDGALSVPGAVDDTRRTIEWMYDHLGSITKIYASLDSHLPNQIFSPSWWRDQQGNHPAPFTVITNEEVTDGVWTPLYEVEWSREYTQRLEEQARKQLMIWPYHTLIGTPGHAITPALFEAIAYHSAARQTQPRFITKGTIPRTEHYSLFEPEVKLNPDDPDSVNTELLNELAGYDRVYFAGQAKSHCVLESVTSLMRYFDNQPAITHKFYLLEDAMSSVANPDIDFEAIANDAYAKFAQQGLKRTTTREASP